MFKFDRSDDFDECADNTTTASAEHTLAILAKEVYAETQSLGSLDINKTKRYVLKNGEMLICKSSNVIENEIKSAGTVQSNCSIAQALSAETDLVPYVYEGGLKVWECSIDLTEYLSSLGLALQGRKVLELGCGSGLPGLYALMKGASEVHFQDYNEEVIQKLTIPNVLLNTDEQKLKLCRFFSGDWESLEKMLLSLNEKTSDALYDIILTSETIYSPLSYKKLHSAMASLLKPDGVIYLAAKTCYFGVGGGTRDFEDYIHKESTFDISVAKEFTDGVQREILKLIFKSFI